MGIVNSIKSTIRDITNQNAVANLADVNAAIKQYDAANMQKIITAYELTWPVGVSAITVANPASGPGKNCSNGVCKNCCPTPGHPSCGTSCNCATAGDNKFCGKIDAIIVVTGPGVFELNLSTTGSPFTADFNMVSLGNPSNPGDIISVEKMNNSLFIVKVYNVISGAYVSGTLKQVPLFIVSDLTAA